MYRIGPIEKAKYYIMEHSNQGKKEIERNTAGPCITISRETGARADKISELLIEIFNKIDGTAHWAVFDKNIIEKVLQDHHLPHTLEKLMEEKKYPAMKSLMNELLVGQPSVWSLVHKTTETILQLAAIGNAIILDRGANIITAKLPNTFHVRLVAPLENRIFHVQELYNFDKKEALDFVRREDADRKEYLMNYFHKEITDPLIYNIIINTGQLTDEECAEIIRQAVFKKLGTSFSNN